MRHGSSMMDAVACVGVAFGILPSFLPPRSVYYDFTTRYNAVIKLLAISSFRTPFRCVLVPREHQETVFLVHILMKSF